MTKYRNMNSQCPFLPLFYFLAYFIQKWHDKCEVIYRLAWQNIHTIYTRIHNLVVSLLFHFVVIQSIYNVAY
jgi:hypothetical protein